MSLKLMAVLSGALATTRFIVADTQLYKRLCPSVSPSVSGDEIKSGKTSIIVIVYMGVWELGV